MRDWLVLVEEYSAWAFTESPWPITLVSLCMLLLIGRAAGWNGRRNRADGLLQTIRENSPHPVRVHQGPSGSGFVVESYPAPEPFEQVMIVYAPLSRVDPFDLVRRLFGGRAERLMIRGMLRTRPSAELVWHYNANPAERLGRQPGARAWTHRRLDFNQAQYSIRGTGVAALEHVFAEFQTRFRNALQVFVVRSDQRPHVEIVMATERWDPIAVAGLLISLRAVGRAALL